MTDNERVIDKALKTYGISAQTLQLSEEVGELLQAASKLLRGTDNGKISFKLLDNFAEELADVWFVSEQLMFYWGISEYQVRNWREYKIRRLKARMEADDVS